MATRPFGAVEGAGGVELSGSGTDCGARLSIAAIGRMGLIALKTGMKGRPNAEALRANRKRDG